MRNDAIRGGGGVRAFAVAGLYFAITFLTHGQQQPAVEPAKAAEPPAAAEYVGSEVCQACHEDIFTAFGKTPHHQVENSKKFGRVGQACESCHGPASKHTESASAEDIRNPVKLRASQTDQLCLACHLNQPTHMGRLQSGHAKGQVSCTGCHTIHGAASTLVAKKPAQVNAQCSACHVSTWSQFQSPHAHRVAQGAMSCVDCHNPHGAFRPQQVRTFAAMNRAACVVTPINVGHLHSNMLRCVRKGVNPVTSRMGRPIHAC
jgi:hypothetical protein